MKNAPQMKRKVVRTKNEYREFVSSQNNRTNVYTTVYDFTEFSEKNKIDSSVVLDRIFLDFDAHGEDGLKEAFTDVVTIMDYIKSNDWERSLFFSGRGFHLFIEGEPTTSIRNIQVFFNEVKSQLRQNSTLDERVGQVTRLRRIPNTVNLSSRGENGEPFFCVPLFDKDLKKGLEWVLEIAKTPRNIPVRKEGSVKVVFPDAPPIEQVEGEVAVPHYDGKLPILPCLHNAVMSENPDHLSRAYLVSWYRDLLTGCTKLVSNAEKDKVLDMIVDEIEDVFGNREEVWLDFDKATTKKHAKFTVYGNYKTPYCEKLIADGYCIGRCWRYPDYLFKEAN